jgi:hypothetical protein
MKWAKTFVKPKIYHDNKISQKFAHFCLIFAFRENEKKHFCFNPSGITMENVIS